MVAVKAEFIIALDLYHKPNAAQENRVNVRRTRANLKAMSYQEFESLLVCFAPKSRRTIQA